MKKSHKIILSVAAICLLGVCVWLGCRAFCDISLARYDMRLAPHDIFAPQIRYVSAPCGTDNVKPPNP